MVDDKEKPIKSFNHRSSDVVPKGCLALNPELSYRMKKIDEWIKNSPASVRLQLSGRNDLVSN